MLAPAKVVGATGSRSSLSVSGNTGCRTYLECSIAAASRLSAKCPNDLFGELENGMARLRGGVGDPMWPWLKRYERQIREARGAEQVFGAIWVHIYVVVLLVFYEFYVYVYSGVGRY